MMHVFRLFAMAEEIGRSGKICVRQPESEFLFKVRRGEFFYEELVDMANQKMDEIEEIFRVSTLPKVPDANRINQLLVDMRKEFYLG